MARKLDAATANTEETGGSAALSQAPISTFAQANQQRGGFYDNSKSRVSNSKRQCFWNYHMIAHIRISNLVDRMFSIECCLGLSKAFSIDLRDVGKISDKAERLPEELRKGSTIRNIGQSRLPCTLDWTI